jgi:predicted DNA-binding helix-hairpin-helix protein
MHLEAAEDKGTIPALQPQMPEERKANSLLPCGQMRNSLPDQPEQDFLGVTQAVMPGGKTIPLLKTMLTSACERNCYYCPFRAGRNYKRTTFRPQEMANTFVDMYRAGLVEGLFLSSGIIRGSVTTQDKLIDTVDILRNKMGFKGYIHLKVMPGAEREQVRQSMALASRVSVNLEGANNRRLRMLAPKKVFFEELLRPLQWIEQIRREEEPFSAWNGRWASSITQFVVGAVGENDLELMTTTSYLYRQAKLSRTYFMAFNPVVDTPFENLPAENPWRQHRLYQASFLLRDYQFDMEDLPFDRNGYLPLNKDPKLAWAQANLVEQPVEINDADKSELMRVPGLGPKGVNTILKTRRENKIRYLSDLKAIGINTSRPAPFVLLGGRRPSYQLRLFPGKY